MVERIFESVQTHLSVAAETSPAKAAPGSPFRMLVLGDFSGRANRRVLQADALKHARPLLIDRDNFEEVMRKLGAQLQLDLYGQGSQRIGVVPGCLEDFHPDRLYDDSEAFLSLRGLRKRLADPGTFAQAKAEMSNWAGGTPGAARAEPEQTAPDARIAAQPPAAGGSALLDQMLSDSVGQRPAHSQREWYTLLRNLVAPYVVPAADPMQAELTGYVDATIGALMRAVLHHAEFQELEAAWRALWMLVSGLPTGTELKLYVLDFDKAELCAELGSADDLRATGLHRLLVQQAAETFGGESWGLVAANYTFDDSVADVEALGRIAQIAHAAGTPFIAAASARILGCAALAGTPDPDDWARRDDASRPWEALRRTPQARYLGLALPRVLMRLPYGKQTDATQNFAFEEMDEPPQHEHYLWSNPSLACAYLIGRTFARAGWNFSSGIERDIEGLPLHVYRDAGESVVKPCAETLLTERVAGRMLDHGLIPLASIKDTDTVRLVRLQSIAAPLSSLAGRWS